MDKVKRFASVLLLLALAGCTGSLDAGPSSLKPRTLACEGAPRAIAVPMRRLTPDEYQSSLVALFGPDVPNVGGTYPQPLDGYAYSTYADAHRVGETQAEAILVTAENVAEYLAPSLPSCSGRALAECARDYLAPLVSRAFRRPASTEDVSRLVAVAEGAASDGLAPNEALAVAIVALLQEPRFLYVVESRADMPQWTLDGHERAQRLALSYWHELPDTMLSSEAMSGSLETEAGFAMSSTRVTSDRRARATFHRFAREWLLIGTLPTSHDPLVRASLDQELEHLLDDAWNAPDGLDALLHSDAAYVNTTLEEFYGLPHTSAGPADFRRVSMPGRVGLLTHPLVLAAASHGAASSPILRGKLIRRQILCGQLGNAPPGAAAHEPVLPADATVRERYEARSMNPTCAGCHRLMDPAGFGLERFDGLGRMRTMVNGRPIDERANIADAGDASGTFSDGASMLDAIAQSDTATSCFARQFVRYSLGRTESADSMCAVADIESAFRESGRSIPALFSALANDPAFVTRTAEVTP